MDQVIKTGGTKVSRKCRAKDPEFYGVVERCRRLATEKAKLQEHVERLEAELEHRRLDAWAQRQAEEAELAFYVAAMADDVTDRIGQSTPSKRL